MTLNENTKVNEARTKKVDMEESDKNNIDIAAGGGIQKNSNFVIWLRKNL